MHEERSSCISTEYGSYRGTSRSVVTRGVVKGLFRGEPLQAGGVVPGSFGDKRPPIGTDKRRAIV